MPWTLRDAEPLALRRTGRRAGNDGGGFALTVRFPPSLHTHCPVQTIYFAADGLIVRHDYVADIVGTFARGAHFWRDYVTVEGIPSQPAGSSMCASSASRCRWSRSTRTSNRPPSR